MINRLNIHLSYNCNLNCSYCFLKNETRKDKSVFTRWDDLLNFLKRAPLGEELIVNLASGELSLRPSLIEKAYSEFKKIERYVDTKVKLGLYTNGTNIDVVLKYLEDGILDPSYTSLSWDGIDNSRTRQGLSGNNNDLLKQAIVKIGKSRFADKFLIRSALTRNLLDNIEATLGFLDLAGCKNWEYYYLIDNDEYRDKKFQEDFTKALTIIYDRQHNLNIFNVNSMDRYYSDTNGVKKLWCKSLDDSIDISIEGKILPCGSYSNNYKYGVPKTDFDDINDYFNESKIKELNNHNCLNCQKCQYQTCGNLHCVECSRMVSYRAGDSFDYKATQPCALRTIEREKYFLRK